MHAGQQNYSQVLCLSTITARDRMALPQPCFPANEMRAKEANFTNA